MTEAEQKSLPTPFIVFLLLLAAALSILETGIATGGGVITSYSIHYTKLYEAADETGGARQPFGQVVRGFTPGHLKQAAAAAHAQTEYAGDPAASDPTAVQA